MKYALFFISLFVGGAAIAQQAGYRNITLTDSSRRYKPGAPAGDRFYYRPIEIDCWYPAVAGGAAPIHYEEFLQLFEERANRLQNDTIYTGLAGDMTRYLCAGLGITDTTRLMNFPTQSYRDARATMGSRPPLLVYMCAFNGMSYENTRLFEALARRGYIVASITSVGRYPGNMTMDAADLAEHVADGVFAVNFLRRSGTVDSTRMGVIGYSWGGPAALLLAGQVPVKAVLSLDGSELHYYGQSGEEDISFNRLRPALLSSTRSAYAYAYLASDGKQNEAPADSIFNLLPAFPGPKKYILYPGATHEDFSCMPYLAASIGKKDISTLVDYISFAAGWFDDHIKNTLTKLPENSPYPVVRRTGNMTTIAGSILDADDKTPLVYVNVGIAAKNKGTVTGEDGKFTLSVDSSMAGDSLAISMAGYEKRVLSLKKLPATILLRRKSGGLPEAVVSSVIPRKKILGNKTTSKMLSVGMPMRFLGAEIGVVMSLGKHPRRLERFRCHVSDSRVDSAVFRLNIYRMVKGIPENILQQNLLLLIGREPGEYTIDLSSLKLILSGDVLVSLEFLRNYSPEPNVGVVFFSAALFNSATWRRQTSQAAWKKARGIGVGFNLEVR